MYINYDSNYNKNVLSDSREWNVYRIAYYNNGSWSTIADAKKYLRSFNLSDNSSDGSNITMGYVCGCKAVIEFKNAPTSLANRFVEGTQIMLYLSLKGKESDTYSSQLNTAPLVIDEVKVVPIMSGRNITVTAYDLSYLMTHEYVSAYENPTALEVVTEIATKYGLTVDGSVSTKIAELGSSLSNMTFKPLSGFTCKQTLGYIAGCFGCNARVGIGKKIYFEWYETSSMPDIGNDIVYLGGSTLSERFTVKLIETGTSENPIVYPNNTSGYSINFENPYITADLARLIYDNKVANNKISFRTGKVKYKGNPINTSGKIVKTTDIDNAPVTFYIMKRTLNYDGGLSETIECFGESETTINYKITSPTQQRINRALSRMEEAIKKSTDVITQTKGSTFELISVDVNDATKGNAGFKIHYEDTGSSAFDDCVIMGTAGGVGLSTNNGETFATAMYFYEDEDTGEIIGAINGEVIRAGSITADKINTSALVVGGGNYEDLESLLNGVVDTANNSITKVDVLYGKNQSTTTPPTNWSTDAPTWENGWYIWTKTQTTAGGVTSETQPVCITGAKGQTGSTGATGSAGADGEDGLGISKIEEQYYLSTSNTSVTGGSWSTNQPAWAKNKYIWTRSKITWEDNTFTYTDAVLAKAINGANETANSAKNALVELCTNNDMTLIDGAKIYTGSIAANSVDVNTLSVGTGVALNQFYNDEFYDGTMGWYAYNGTLTAQGKNQSYAYMQLKPSNSAEQSVIMQKLWLVQGQRYAIAAQVCPLGWEKSRNDVSIHYFIGTGWSSAGLDLNGVYNPNNLETVVKMVFDYNGNTGFVDLGIAFRGILTSSSEPCTINIAWMSFSNATGETPGFYCTRKEWLASNYKDSNYLGGSVNNNTTADAYLTQKALSVDSNGNLVTLGTIKSDNGEIGSMTYNSDRIDITTHAYYLYLSLPTFATSRISLINPPEYAEFGLTSPDYKNEAERGQRMSARIEVASSAKIKTDDGSELVGNEYAMITSSGVSVSDYSSHSSISAYGIDIDGVSLTKTELTALKRLIQ